MADGKKLPKWAQQFLQEQDLEKIEKAVADAELLTAAEIVPMVVRSSMQTHWVRLYLSFMICVSFIAAGGLRVMDHYFEYHAWILDLGLDHLAGVVVSLAVAYVIAGFLEKIPAVVRLLAPDRMESQAVWERAVREFYTSRIQQTRGRTGVLLFFSLLERKAVVLTDESIAKAIDNSVWDKLIVDVVSAKKQGRLGEGLVQKITQCGDLLKESFPRDPAHPNELSNFLIIKE